MRQESCEFEASLGYIVRPKSLVGGRKGGSKERRKGGREGKEEGRRKNREEERKKGGRKEEEGRKQFLTERTLWTIPLRQF